MQRPAERPANHPTKTSFYGLKFPPNLAIPIDDKKPRRHYVLTIYKIDDMEPFRIPPILGRKVRFATWKTGYCHVSHCLFTMMYVELKQTVRPSFSSNSLWNSVSWTIRVGERVTDDSFLVKEYIEQLDMYWEEDGYLIEEIMANPLWRIQLSLNSRMGRFRSVRQFQNRKEFYDTRSKFSHTI